MKRKVIRTAITSVLVTSMCMGSLPTAAAAMQAASKRAELSASLAGSLLAQADSARYMERLNNGTLADAMQNSNGGGVSPIK